MCLSARLVDLNLNLVLSIISFPSPFPAVELTDVQSIANPLDKVEAGLQAGGKPVPLQSVHVRAKLMDLAAQVRSGHDFHMSQLHGDLLFNLAYSMIGHRRTQGLEV